MSGRGEGSVVTTKTGLARSSRGAVTNVSRGPSATDVASEHHVAYDFDPVRTGHSARALPRTRVVSVLPPERATRQNPVRTTGITLVRDLPRRNVFKAAADAWGVPHAPARRHGHDHVQRSATDSQRRWSLTGAPSLLSVRPGSSPSPPQPTLPPIVGGITRPRRQHRAP